MITEEELKQIGVELFGEKQISFYTKNSVVPPVKIIDKQYDIKEQWKIFCRTLYANCLQMEKKAEKDFVGSRKAGLPFVERKKIADKISWCKKRQQALVKSVKDREFILEEEDYDIINARGFKTWFRIYDDYFYRLSYPLDI